MNIKSLLGIFVAVFLGLLAYHWYVSYSESHMRFVVQKVEGGTDNSFVVESVWTPTERAKAVNVYMIPFYAVKDKNPSLPPGDWWGQEYGTDQEIQSGDTLFGDSFGNTNDRVRKYVVVCTTKDLKSYKQIWQEAWNNFLHTSEFLYPSDLPNTFVLECR